MRTLSIDLKTFCWWFLVLAYFTLLISGKYNFHLWYQVEEVRADYDTGSVEIYNNRHFLRFLIVFPIYWISNLTGIEANRLFSLVVGLNMIASALFCNRAISLINGESSKNVGRLLNLTLMMIFLSFFMNGRLSYSQLAMAMTLWAVTSWEVGRVNSVGLGVFALMSVFLSTVSSGTFSVVFSFYLLWSVFKTIHYYYNSVEITKVRRIQGWTILAVGAVVGIFFPLFIAFLKYNLQFFGVGIEQFWKMLIHGAGAFLLTLNSVPLIEIGLIGICLLSLVTLFYVKVPVMRNPVLGISISLLGGLFAYSALTMAIIPLLMFLFLIFSKFKMYTKHSLCA